LGARTRNRAHSLIEAAGVLGARYGQGFGLAKPMPADEILPWSETFTLSPTGEEIHTYTGALAFHWQYMHERGAHYPSGVEDCPLSRFLDEMGLAQSEAAAIHADLHSGVDLMANSRRFTDWLVEQVRAEVSPA
jgi:hypothetical protein